MSVQIGKIKNPTMNEFGQILCLVEIRSGDGVGAKWQLEHYVAARGDVAATGNEVWAKLCSGDFTCDDDHEINFDYADLIPDEIQD